MSVVIIITPPPTKPPGSGTLRNSDAQSLIDATAAHDLIDEAIGKGCRVRIIDTDADA